MREWLLHSLADRLGVAPAGAGEAINSPHPVRAALAAVAPRLHGAGKCGLDPVALSARRQGADRVQAVPRQLADHCSCSLAMFMLSEAVLSVERNGLPYLTILIDDSASQRIADQYEKPEVKAALEAMAAPARGRPDHATGHRQGADLEGPGQADPGAGKATQGQALSRLERGSASSPRSIGRTRWSAGSELVRAIEADGGQTRLGDGVRHVLTELRGAPPSAIILLTDGQTTEGEPLAKASELAAHKGVPALIPSVWEAPSRPTTSS